MVLRISGDRGSGKTTLCSELAKILGYFYVYTGGIIREMATKKNMPLEEFYRAMDADPGLERSIDASQEELMLTMPNLIAEGRMAPFQKCAFPCLNVFIAVDRIVGAERQLQRPENRGRSLAEVLRRSDERLKEERIRYQKLYGIIDHLDKTKFDVIVDTTNLTKEAAIQELVISLLKHLASRS